MSAAIAFEWAFEPPLELVWEHAPSKTEIAAIKHSQRVAVLIGPPGPSTPSADAGNQLTNGSDGGLFMGPPQLETAQW